MIIFMDKIEILSLIVTIICLLSFSTVFTILFRNYNLNAIDSIKEGKEDIDLIDSCLIEEEKKKSKKHKTIKILSKITYFTLYSIVFTFFAFSLTSRILDNNMLFGDTGIIVIATGSMSKKNKENTYLEQNGLDNQFNAYDIIQIKRYNSGEKPKLYDVIAFKSDDGKTIVHRIIDIKVDEVTNEYTFRTKGDANSAEDYGNLYQKLTEDKIIGHYTNKNLPAIGSFVIFLQSNSGIITIVSITYCVFMFDYYRNKLEKTITDRTNLLVELINYDANSPEIANTFKQELMYKGYKYCFEQGIFKDKIKIDEKQIDNLSNENMYSMVTDDSGEKECTIKNIASGHIEILNKDVIASLDSLIADCSKEIK